MSGYGLISVAGLIGVGKTTLARQLACRLEAHLLEEPYDRNPHIEQQYAGQADAALASQIFFLKSRVEQLRVGETSRYPTVVTDYVYQKDRIFARLCLTQQQYDEYEQLAGTLDGLITAPSRVVYLQDTLENCLERIKRRGRAFEKGISATFLGQLSEAYEQMFESWSQCPVVRVDCAEHDVRNEATVDWVVEQMALTVHSS